LSDVYPDALEQRYWNHTVLKVLDKLPKRVRLKARRQLQNRVYSEGRQEAEEKLDLFVRWYQGKESVSQ
jgi:putative transposase